MPMRLKGILTFAAIVGVAGAASAADIYQAPPPISSPIYTPTPIYDWTGVYVGLNGGYSWGQSKASTGSTFDIPLNGWLAGGQLGANWMLSNNIVLGIEGDIAWTGQKGTVVTPGPTVTQSLNWLGTVRGRLGVAMNNVMPYVTGGFAAGGATRTSTIGPVSESKTHTGYVLGAGVEWGFTQNWTAKLEYQYVNLGAQTYATIPADPSVGITDHIVKVGVNYKF